MASLTSRPLTGAGTARGAGGLPSAAARAGGVLLLVLLLMFTFASGGCVYVNRVLGAVIVLATLTTNGSKSPIFTSSPRADGGRTLRAFAATPAGTPIWISSSRSSLSSSSTARFALFFCVCVGVSVFMGACVGD